MVFLELAAILISYLLGSIPFGYLITRLSTGQDILEIGGRKTSGSNVFKNVGFWQGALSGICDFLKGALAVWLARYLGLTLPMQALCGVAVITGNNWSCFLRFAGGRGIGAFIGALLVLSPQIMLLTLIPLALLALVWDAAIGTIVSLVTAVVLTTSNGQMTTIGILPLLSIIPIFVKRLSPLRELSFRDLGLIKNRLVFDNDQPHLKLRKWRILKRHVKS